MNGKVRDADVGLLYDPTRRGEADLCARWKASLAVIAPQLRVRRTDPYAGKGDGLTSALRVAFPGSAYIGIELEVNQQIVLAAGRRWSTIRSALIDSLGMACAGSARHGERPASRDGAKVHSPIFGASHARRRVAITGES